ncbi:hypothetical protein GCM10020256_43360 [Streptomyces thermocoprophilus]
MQGEHIALADAGLGERGGEAPVEAVHLLVGEGGAVGAVDQGGRVPEVGGTAQDRLVDGEIDGRDVCVLAAEHGSSSHDGVPDGAVLPGRAVPGQYDLGRPRV